MAWYTHDDPAHAAAERAKLDQEVRELLQLHFVWYRHDTIVQHKATITRAHTLELVDLLVMPDASTSLGGRDGEPTPMRDIRLGPGHYAWSRDLDPPKEI